MIMSLWENKGTQLKLVTTVTGSAGGVLFQAGALPNTVKCSYQSIRALIKIG